MEKDLVIADPRVGDDQIFLHLATYAERRVVEIQGALLGSLHEYEAGKYP
jgi:hypothetical protein